MPFRLNLLNPRNSPTAPHHDDYDGNCSSSSSSSSSTESNVTVRSSRGAGAAASARSRTTLHRSSPTTSASASATILGPPEFLLPHSVNQSPIPSRSSSPLPIHYVSPGASSSSYTSDADSEPTSPLLAFTNSRRSSWWNDDNRGWWLIGTRPEDVRRRRRRLRRETRFGVRMLKRQLRRLIRHPFFPRQPTSIIFTLLIFTVIAILVTLLLMHILNPDKASLPWRTYCSIPSSSTVPPSLTLSPTDEPLTVQVPIGFDPTSTNEPITPNPFPPPYLDAIPPAGIFLGVFTTDSAIERRMFIRTSWASHERSRAGAGDGDGGNGTSRTIVRFVLGRPRSDWERRIQLESEAYNDMIELPIVENMNYGKTHAFFTWAAENAWVPPPSTSDRLFSYSNHTVLPPPLAPHDPIPSSSTRGWVRPDFVVKADDDSFVMLAELEARLRVELDDALRAATAQRLARESLHNLAAKLMFANAHPYAHLAAADADADSHIPSQLFSGGREIPSWISQDTFYPSAYGTLANSPVLANNTNPRSDPLIYWGYLVKNRFMAGELYALSWSLVDWVATEPTIRLMTRGAEDKQTAKWMRRHPRAEEIRWATDRCWIYDHPKAGTVYSHGFLFPSEATRVRRSILTLLRPLRNVISSPEDKTGSSPSSTAASGPSSGGNGEQKTVTYILPPPMLPTTPSYSYSSVTQFGTHYTFPLETLTPEESIEALVEGSPMSDLFEGGPVTAAQAWARREGRRKRYEGKRVGGTVVVHFIKRNEWFLETALALLGGEEVLDGEEGSTKEPQNSRLTNEALQTRSQLHVVHQALSRQRRP